MLGATKEIRFGQLRKSRAISPGPFRGGKTGNHRKQCSSDPISKPCGCQKGNPVGASVAICDYRSNGNARFALRFLFALRENWKVPSVRSLGMLLGSRLLSPLAVFLFSAAVLAQQSGSADPALLPPKT